MGTLAHFVFWSCFVCVVNGHGYVVDPLSRSAANNNNANKWKICNTGQPDYTPQGSNCGGASTQNDRNGGKCGACGDNFNGPRLHQYGGKYVTSIKPVRVYLEGQLIDTEVYFSAAHLGEFHFKICDILESATSDPMALDRCFYNDTNKRLTDENGNELSFGVVEGGYYKQQVKLPDGFTCPDGCTMQWFYKAGNNAGDKQEHFINCADIAIVTCQQYKDGKFKKDETWCGQGPTEELKECTVSDSPSGGNTGGNNGGYNGGNNGGYDGGYGGGNDGGYGGGNDGGYGGGNDGGYGGGNDGGYGGHAGDDGSGSNCPNEDNSADGQFCNDCTTAQSPTCDNSCCSEAEHDVYISTTSGAPDTWCQSHCTGRPPFCPAMWCQKYKAIHWVNTCSAKRSLTAIVDKLERKAADDLRRQTNGAEKNPKALLRAVDDLLKLSDKLKGDPKPLAKEAEALRKLRNKLKETKTPSAKVGLPKRPKGDVKDDEHTPIA